MIVLLILTLLFSFQVAVFGYQPLEPWGETWTNIAYLDTNFERTGFSSILGRSEGRLGVHLFTLWDDVTLKPYLVYYAVSSKDESYWNNNVATGFGLHIKPFKNYKGGIWDEWISDIKIFGESLNIQYSKGASSAEAEEKPFHDTRYGFDLWHEWNQTEAKFDPSYPWAELWANISYRSTNFFAPSKYEENEFNTILFYFQPKIGLYSQLSNFSLEPYLRSDLVIGGKYYWLNNIDYGAGIRISPFQGISPEFWYASIMRKFRFFVEILGITYFAEREYLGEKKDLPQSDFRIGIDLSYGR